ncbi:MAG: hypothetical protein LIO74_04910 [Ruminococcus sp.]|nr:hypothetical protein [Ruminococcus sp.]
MKGKLIAALVVTVVTASIATIAALKKARDKKIIQSEEDDWITEYDEIPDEDADIDEETAVQAAESSCCACDTEEDDVEAASSVETDTPEADAPVQVHLDDPEKSE